MQLLIQTAFDSKFYEFTGIKVNEHEYNTIKTTTGWSFFSELSIGMVFGSEP